MSKEEIAILHYSAPPVVGGVEAVIQAHARAFVQAGYPVTIFAGWGEEEALPEGVDFVRIPEMDTQFEQVIEIGAELEEGNIPSEFDELTSHLVSVLTPELADFEHVIVHNVFTKHFNLPLTAALVHLLEAGTIQHCIAWCHDFTWTSSSSRAKVHDGYPWDLLRTRRSDVTYVVVSQQRQQALAELFDCPLEQIHVVYNGVDPQELLGLSEEGMALVERLDLLDSGLILLMPVRVTHAKNIEYAMEVLAALKARDCRPKLVLTGPPDPHDAESMAYFRELQTLRRQLGVQDEMRFVFESGPEPDEPYTIGPDLVGELFRVSDLMFMPSHREGFGMPVLEAGLAGVPVFCTDMPAAKEIGGEDVVLFDPVQGADNLAEQILGWVEDSRVHRLRRRVRQDYTWRAILYRDIEPLLKD